MILDDNLISVECGDLTGEIEGKAIDLSGFQKPGRMNPIPFYVGVMGDDAPEGGTSITIKLEQADTKCGDFAEIEGLEKTVKLEDMKRGINLGWRFLPPCVTKPWIKVKITKEGEFSKGKMFAAVVSEDYFPYEDGMYIDAGEVKG